MTRQEKETTGIENARKDFTNERISNIIKQYNITSVKLTLQYAGLYMKCRFRAYNDNAPKYKNRPVFVIEKDPNVVNNSYLKEVYKLFSEKLA